MTNLEDVRGHVVGHLQHLRQISAQWHVWLSPRQGEETQGQLSGRQRLTHISVGLQLLHEVVLCKRLQQLLWIHNHNYRNISLHYKHV